MIITYDYDPLYRLTSATYSDGRSFGYDYDAVGNALQYSQNLGGSTVTTTYNYNNANQLTTAQMDNSPIVWEYAYDPNGRLTDILPDGIAANGAKQYTYNTAGYLTQTKAHDGSGYQLQAEMLYDGLGQRLMMTGYALETSITTNYVLDPMQYARPLTATSAGNTTVYLYGIDPIAEFTTDWSYSLPDGTNTPRQLTNSVGEITLSGRYTPWGDSLDYTGTGNFTFGYFGGLMDSATGLLYVGNGQYYDPATGRFLTRDVNPNSPNPYVPWGDPTGALFAPLALVGLIYGRKRKKSKFDYFVIVLFVVAGVGMGLSACAPQPAPPTLPGSPQPPTVPPASPSVPNIPPPSQTPAPFVPPPPPVTSTSILDQIFATPCPTPTLWPIGTPTQAPPPANLATEEQKREYIASFGITLVGNWTGAYLTNLWEALFTHIGYQDLAKWMGGQKATMERAGPAVCKEGETACYSGSTPGTTIYFYAMGGIANPVINMLHEIGHLVDNLWHDYFTTKLEKTIFTLNGEYLAGWNSASYVSLPRDRVNNLAVYSSHVGGGRAWQQGGGTPHWEDWADIFANSMIGNINQSSDLGAQMDTFFKDMESHVMGGTP